MERPPEKWLEAMVHSAPDAIIVLDTARCIRFANAAALRFATRSGSEGNLIGRSYDAILAGSNILDEHGSPAAPDSFPTHLALKHGRETRDRVFEQVHANQHYWVSVACTPIFDENGKPAYAVARFRDISRQKTLEEKLRLLVKSGSALSLATDTVTRLSEKARMIVPDLADWCTVNIVAGDALTRVAVIHRDPRKETLVADLARLSAEELGSEVGIHAVRKTGQPQFNPDVRLDDFASVGMSPERLRLMYALKPTSSMILPIRSQNELVGILSLAYADSGRRYRQEDFAFMQEFCHHLGVIIDNARLYEEVHKRDKAKERFLANLSHELRNPLAPIKTHLELLSLMNDDERYRAEIALIEHQFNHLTKLLNDLLDVSRYTLGKIELERSPTALGELIKRIVRVQEPHIRQKRIALVVGLPEEDICVSADPTRLEQAVLNILHNAEKFTPGGGAINLSLARDDGSAIICVSDTGAGMDAEELANVFDAGGTRAHEGGGLGLGLALVREIVRLHGGRVEAISDGPGRGSMFTIFMPLERPAAHPPLAARAHKGSVL